VLGTGLALRFLAESPPAADRAEGVALAVFRELALVFDIHDPGSELSRWNAASPGTRWRPSSEMLCVLDAAFDWWRRTDGAFHPGCDEAVRMWRRAEDQGEMPAVECRRDLAARLLEAPWVCVHDDAVVRGPVAVNLNAIAKGHIVDRAAVAALSVDGIRAVMVNAGGDIRVEGSDGLVVPVADPDALADNAVPADLVRVTSGGVATSGTGRRGFRVGATWLGHVIDPRTAEPVAGAVLATAVAPSTADADALATAAMVGGAGEALAWADALPGGALRRVATDRTVATNVRWEALRTEETAR